MVSMSYSDPQESEPVPFRRIPQPVSTITVSPTQISVGFAGTNRAKRTLEAWKGEALYGPS